MRLWCERIFLRGILLEEVFPLSLSRSWRCLVRYNPLSCDSGCDGIDTTFSGPFGRLDDNSSMANAQGLRSLYMHLPFLRRRPKIHMTRCRKRCCCQPSCPYLHFPAHHEHYLLGLDYYTDEIFSCFTLGQMCLDRLTLLTCCALKLC